VHLLQECLEKDIELAEYRKELVKIRAELRNCKGEIKDLRAQLRDQEAHTPTNRGTPSPLGRGYIQSDQHRSYPTIQTEGVGRQRSVSNIVPSFFQPKEQGSRHGRRSSAPDGRNTGGGAPSRARVYPMQHLPYNDARDGLGLDPIDSDDDNVFDH
jgi:hypothetical protein